MCFIYKSKAAIRFMDEEMMKIENEKDIYKMMEKKQQKRFSVAYYVWWLSRIGETKIIDVAQS